MTVHKGPDVARVVLEWVSHDDPGAALPALTTFHDWLAAEALGAGGLGPAEAQRLWTRHIADSLTFLAALGDMDSVVDIGSGVGLPGIPLAIARPAMSVTLLDRSARRCWLARRAVRILGLDNVTVVEGDARRLHLPDQAAVSRASFAPDEFFSIARRLLPGGLLAVMAGSHGVSEAPIGSWEIVAVPPDVLGEPAWLASVSLSPADSS